ncbi:MAG TPA: tetratricopeptide repeat protein [Gemmatimonadaceae bacterium]|nr:tetratricopeptide repeat protein [Gemmatimonadaceae bacterium]
MHAFAKVALALGIAPVALAAQRGPSTPQDDSMRQAIQFDLGGDYARARAIFQKLIDGAPDPAAKAAAQRALAISYAFTGECVSAAVLEQKVIDYWVTREQAEPQNAFYQEGEMSNEAARICFDAGDYNAAERYYRRGSALGLKEPEPKTHPASLWDFRLTHALARINVRRGNYEEAAKLVDRARKILDGDKAIAAQQERFYPYLLGYVGLYAYIQDPSAWGGRNWGAIEHNLLTATEMKGNENDPYFHWLLANYYSNVNQVIAECHKALDRATAHNPPSAFVHAHANECMDPALIARRKFTRP